MTKTYRQTIQEGRAERNEGIRRENGWLALAGLFWLKLGKNRIGSDPACEIQLPARVPADVGYFEFNGKSVTVHAASGQKLSINGKQMEFSIMQPDIADDPSYITLYDIRLVVIQRGVRMGIRMWDNQSDKRASFPARTWYDIEESFRVPGTYTPYDRPKTVFFPDLTGEKTESTVDGYLTFNFNGKTYTLDATLDSEAELFVRFKDPTSETETYPTGRYMIVNFDKDGKADVDFNYAYNPPCAFTDFATCVFAPEQNHLDFPVIVGETYQQKHK